MSKAKVGAEFASIEEFYNATREGNIEKLCEKLKKDTAGGSPSEVESWRNSLPDIAELLYKPEEYVKHLEGECDELAKDIDGTIKILKNIKKISNSVQDTTLTSGLEKILPKEKYGKLSAIDTTLKIMNDGDECDEIIKYLKEQKEDVKKEVAREVARVDLKDYRRPFRNVKVMLEYPLPGKGNSPKRIDVLLCNDEKKRYYILELKQWTEDKISVFEKESEETPGETEYFVQIGSGKLGAHPAIEMEKVYKEKLLQELKKKGIEGASVEGLVYYHNQLFYGGILFQVSGGLWNQYSKTWCLEMRKRLTKFFNKRK